MTKRRRGTLPTSGSNRLEDTPSKRTRRQTQATAGAEDNDFVLLTTERRPKERTCSVRIEETVILHSYDGSRAESPEEMHDFPHIPNDEASLDEQDMQSNPPMLQSPQQTKTASSVDFLSSYQAPKREPPVNPRRQSTPVPGTRPKKPVHELLRFAAQYDQFHNFKYEPITADEVRLMRLKRGKSNAPIKVDLITVPFGVLGRKGLFEALSYHWGEDNFDTPLLMRDMSRDPGKLEDMEGAINALRYREKRVKYNLYSALYHLREPDKDLMLWVDALCIDQDNPKEKEVQVARIADIYITAETVLIWLGEGDDHTKEAFKLLRDLANVQKQDTVISDKTRLSQWKDLTHLMKSGWFSRRWVIQELSLAKNANVFCGDDHIHWNDVRDGVSIFVENDDYIRETFRESAEHEHDYYALQELEPLAARIMIEKVGDVFRKESKGKSFVAAQGLEHLVSSLFAFHTSDPRDTINALINISKEGVGLSGRVRESIKAIPQAKRKHTTVLDSLRRIKPVVHEGKEPLPLPSYLNDLLIVYINFLRWIVSSTGSINMLCRHWAIRERSREESGYPELVKLPTWIKLADEGPFKQDHKDHVWVRQNADSLVGLPGQSPYNACTSYYDQAEVEFKIYKASRLTASGPVPSDLRKSASIRVKGFQLGAIHRCTDPMSGGNISKPALDMLGYRRSGSSQQVEELSDDIWRPLVAERGTGGRDPPQLWRKCCTDILVNHSPEGSININMILPKIKSRHTKKFLRRMRQVTYNRTFIEVQLSNVFKDEFGSPIRCIGLGPSDAVLGDIVCILYGCTVPCTLRPQRNRDGTGEVFYDFIGETYVYGFMAGEAVTMLKEKDLKAQEKFFTMF